MIFDTQEYFKAIAEKEENNWGFSYGTREHQNVYDVTKAIDNAINDSEKDVVLYCREINQDTHKKIVNFELILARKSDFTDASYEKKDKETIKPMKDLMESEIYEKVDCEMDISKFTIYDVTNEFDSNVDGVLANVTAKFYE